MIKLGILGNCSSDMSKGDLKWLNVEAPKLQKGLSEPKYICFVAVLLLDIEFFYLSSIL